MNSLKKYKFGWKHYILMVFDDIFKIQLDLQNLLDRFLGKSTENRNSLKSYVQFEKEVSLQYGSLSSST